MQSLLNANFLLLFFPPIFWYFLVTVCEAQSTATDDMGETIAYSDFESDSDSEPIFVMDELSTEGSDTDDENIPKNQNQNNVSKFTF